MPPQKRPRIDHTDERSSLQSSSHCLQTDPFTGRGTLDSLPNEILSKILKEYLHDYFRFTQKLTRFPTILHVCRLWRNLAISNPDCWSRISVDISTQSKMKYVRRRIEDRDTKVKAIQDTLNCYFKWAKSCPVDLTINFSHHFGNSVKAQLLHWLTRYLPALKSYKELQACGMFLTLLPMLPAKCYNDIVTLDFGATQYDYALDRDFHMPNLRRLRLPRQGPNESRIFLQKLHAPILEDLSISITCPHTFFTGLKQFPLIRELLLTALLRQRESPPLTTFPKLELLQRLAIINGSAKLIDLLLRNYRSFPNLKEWSLPQDFMKKLVKRPDVEELPYQGVTSLTITPARFDFMDADEEGTELKGVFNHFPGVVQLTLQPLEYGVRKLHFTSEERQAVDGDTGEPIKALLRLLRVRTEDHSIKYCPQLRKLALLDTKLRLQTLSILETILLTRGTISGRLACMFKDVEGTSERKLKIMTRNCIIEDVVHNGKYRVRKSVKVDDQELSLSTIHQLQHKLQGAEQTQHLDTAEDWKETKPEVIEEILKGYDSEGHDIDSRLVREDQNPGASYGFF